MLVQKYQYNRMTPVLLSLLFAGLASFAMLCLFFVLVPRLAGDGTSISSTLVQWLLIAVFVFPAIAAAIFGPSWLYEVSFSRATTKDQRLWLIIAGVGLLAVCVFGALQSAPGKIYSSWRTRAA